MSGERNTLAIVTYSLVRWWTSFLTSLSMSASTDEAGGRTVMYRPTVRPR